MAKFAEIELGGEVRRLALDANAQIAFHKLTGRSIFEMGPSLIGQDIPIGARLDALRTVIWGMMATHHPSFEMDLSTVRTVGGWFDLDDLPRIYAAIMPLLNDTIEKLQKRIAPEFEGQMAPFVPTPPPVVSRMVALADLSTGAHVVDLGAGDGRLMIAAVESEEMVTAAGYEKHQGRYESLKATLAAHKLSPQLSVEQMDVRDAVIAGADAVFLYLMPAANAELKEKLLAEMKPGSRVVSHDFEMPDWKPETIERVQAEDRQHTVYVWRIPASR
jgi:precorrin-6B methylase 2